MNIKVPYDKLGDVSSYEFVSFILDKNRQSIYRLDFVQKNQEFEKFFDREMQYIYIPDEIYNQSDSVIFFPFNKKTNSWGTKVIMWKNEDFVKFNGGYEYIRNGDKQPDIAKIEKWLDTGKKIKPSKKVVGKKNLIYFTLFGNKMYVQLLKLLMESLNKQKYKKFELLFITEPSIKKELEKMSELKEHTVHYHVLNNVGDAVDASMQKLKIYDWNGVSKYKNILFLDVDILVLGDLKNIFECKSVKTNVLYSATHNRSLGMHKTVYHCLVDYTDAQMKNFEKKKITALNAGQFFFKNTESMKKHFKNIDQFIPTWTGRYFFEQSFINYYFNLLEIADTKLFEKQFCFVSINENQTNTTFGKNAVIAHFMGNATNGEGKLEFMNRHYSQYIQ